jgi:hypothetical protein
MSRKFQEEVMKSVAFVAVAAICASLAFAPAASAASMGDCVHLAKEVAAAINSAQPGKATEDARAQANAGRSYCASSMYSQGVASYSKALELLGKN